MSCALALNGVERCISFETWHSYACVGKNIPHVRVGTCDICVREMITTCLLYTRRCWVGLGSVEISVEDGIDVFQIILMWYLPHVLGYR